AESFSINTVGPDGESVYGAFSYDDAARALEAAGVPEPAAAGIVLEHHENGPDLRVPADRLREGRELAAAWASAIGRVAPPQVAVPTALRGWTEPPTPANLRLVLPPGGARQLAGVLADVRLLAVESAEEPAPLWRGGGQWSLAQVEAEPAVSVAP